MNKPFYPSDIYYNQGESAQKVADFLNAIGSWENYSAKLLFVPATLDVTVSDANAGCVVPVTVKAISDEATPTILSFAEFILAASIGKPSPMLPSYRLSMMLLLLL